MGIIKKDPYIQPLSKDWYSNSISEVAMLRLDIVHDVISGNKWYKLKENISHCIRKGKDTILTFGGGYSNHLVATAAAAQNFGIKSIGLVRGEYEYSTPTLDACLAYGMQLHFLSREEYSQKNDMHWLESVKQKFGDPYIVPEGGANAEGVLGAQSIAEYIPDNHYTHIAVSVGTGTTLAGIVNGTSSDVIGFAPMKGGAYLNEEVRTWVDKDRHSMYRIVDDWHFGGFGKWKPPLLDFMNEFYTINSVCLDMVYTGKMMYGVNEMIASGKFSPKDRLLCIHTGGLQGNITIADKLICA